MGVSAAAPRRAKARSAPGGSQWAPLPTGPFTGIPWSAPGAIHNEDPYLVWAEANRFAGYHGGHEDRLPTWLPIVIELGADADIPALVAASSIHWLQVPRVYLNVPGLRFCSAHVKPRFFQRLRTDAHLRGLVKRFELGLPVDHHTHALIDPCTPGCPPVHVPGLLNGPVLGLIDGGLAFANQQFLNRHGRARVKHFWRQDQSEPCISPGNRPHVCEPLDPTRVGPTPRDMGYGHELSGAAIDAAMAAHTHGGQLDEAALYAYLQLRDLSRPVNHGTHVMGLASGKGLPLHPWDDKASRCDLVAVQLDWSNVVDTSGGAMNVSVLDGLMYILARCSTSAQVVVNISWGTLAGPHDGTSVLEAAMDQLVALLGGRLQIAVPAGNAYQSRTHANAALPAHAKTPETGAVTLNWRVQPDDRTESYLEIWLPNNPEGVEITVTPPGQTDALPPLAMGQGRVWLDAQGAPLCGLIYPTHSALGSHGTCALLAVAPTFSRDASVATTLCGVWKVELSNHHHAAKLFDAYIERDDVALGQNTGARQSYLEDKFYDTSGNIKSFVDHADNPTPIRRSGTFNSLSTGRYPVSVGGLRANASPSGHFTLYSPRKPDPDAGRPQRPDVKKVPETLQASDDNPALWGLLGVGSLSGSTVRLVGTSSAAPLQARKMFNEL